MRRLILFLFATLVFTLAQSIPTIAENVTNELIVKPPGVYNANIDITNTYLQLVPVSITPVSITPEVITPISFVTVLNTTTNTKWSTSGQFELLISLDHRSIKPFTMKFRMYVGYSMARLCSLIPLVNMI